MKTIPILLCISDFPYTAPTVQFTKTLLGGGVPGAVTLLTVRPKDEEASLGEQAIAKAKEMLQSHYHTALIRTGKPAKEILQEIRRGKHQLIVIGARDKATLSDLLLGSVTRQIMRKAPVSTLIVRNPVEKIKRIGVCTSGQRVSDTTVSAGAMLAKSIDAEVYLIHVTAVAPKMYTGLMRIEEGIGDLFQVETPLSRRLLRQCKALIERGIDAQLELRHGIAAEEILNATQEHELDMLVVGRSSFRLGHLFMDDVALEVVDRAPRPVLVVKGKLG